MKPNGFIMRVYPGEAMRNNLVQLQSSWRVDKLANKVVFDRQIYALRVLCSWPGGDHGGGPAAHRTISPGLREVIMAEAASQAQQAPDDAPHAEPSLCAQPAGAAQSMFGSGCQPTMFFGRLNNSQQHAVH